METKENLDQDPGTQAAAPVSEDTAKNEVKAESVAQISEDEKAAIISDLHGEAPAEEAPVEEAPVEEAPDEEAPVEEAPVEEAPAEEAPVKEAPVEDETPKAQINKAEKKVIIRLLKGIPAAVEEYLDYTSEEIDFDHLNKLELVELLEEVVEENDFDRVKSQVARINAAYRNLVKEEEEKAKDDFVAGGGDPEAFEHTEDVLDRRFASAFGHYRETKAKHSEEVEKEKQLNLQRKLDLLEELKELINSEETLKKTYDEFKNLQDAWKEIGMVPATELRNLWQSYHFLVEKFFDKVRINKELRDLDMKKNLELKLELCEKAEELLAEQSIIKSFKMLQQYHDEWREIGPVPSDVKEDIWDRFKGASDKINQRRKDHYKELQDQQTGNLEAKKALVEKAHELTAEMPETMKQWQNRVDQMNELMKLWKSIGRAPKEFNDQVWKEFKGKLDGFFNARRSFLNDLKDQQVNNYNLKLDLCIRAEALAESEEWRDTTRQLIELQKEWKGIGPVPRKHADKVWKRFRGACDSFFNRKSTHFKAQHGHEDENLKRKEALVKEITAFEVVDKKAANLDALKNFQRQWVEIGHVPFNMKDKIQGAYRDAIDALMEKMDLNRQEASNADFRNRLEIMKSGPEAGRKLNKERIALVNKMKGIQDDVALWENNIGFFSSSKQADKLKHEFEVKIERARKELEGLKAKLRLLDE